MSECDYPYARGSLLDECNTYTYTSFGGLEFLNAWLSDRRRAQAGLSTPSLPTPTRPRVEHSEFSHDALIETRALMDTIMAGIMQGFLSAQHRWWMNWLVHRFEVTKRLYDTYLEGGKPAQAGSYEKLELYLRFGELLIAAYELEPELPYVNTLLKCMDSLCALCNRLDPTQQGRLSHLIDRERTVITKLAKSQLVPLGHGAF